MTQQDSDQYQHVIIKLLSARKKLGLTQEAMAKVLHVSVTSLSQWENGKKKISKTNQQKIKYLDQISNDKRLTEVLQRYIINTGGATVAVVIVGMILAVSMMSKDGYNAVENLLRPCSQLINAIKELSNNYECSLGNNYDE